MFLDANVIFTAAITPKGCTQSLFDLADAGFCRLLSSPYALEDAERNVSRKYPVSLEQLAAYRAGLLIVPEASQELYQWALSYLPDKDAPVLAAAVAAKADLLVTGDKRHFGSLYGQTLRGVEVITITDAMARLLS